MAMLWATNAPVAETTPAIILPNSSRGLDDTARAGQLGEEGLPAATVAPTMLRRVGVTTGDKAMAITAPATAPATLNLLAECDEVITLADSFE